MKHHHDADVNIKVDIPAQDIEALIDKATEAAVTIIMAYAVAQICKSIFQPKLGAS